jgi:hypothetical protein
MHPWRLLNCGAVKKYPFGAIDGCLHHNLELNAPEELLLLMGQYES